MIVLENMKNSLQEINVSHNGLYPGMSIMELEHQMELISTKYIFQRGGGSR